MEDNKKYVNMTANASLTSYITLGELLRQIQQTNMKPSAQVKNEIKAETEHSNN